MAADNLQQVFNGKIFRVPDYQRGYAWGEKQLIELWEDLEEIVESDGNYRKHYFGTIYLEKTEASPQERWLTGHDFYEVVDGQQRLTTLSIFLFELLKVCEIGYCSESKDDLIKTYLGKKSLTGDNRVFKFAYLETNRNNEFLLRNIFEEQNVHLTAKQNNLYSQNLTSAKVFFERKIEPLSNDEREVIFKKMTTALQFDIRTIDNDLDVQAVFETMNNRGKPLSTLEKLKNRLIFLCEKLKDVGAHDKKNLRSKINAAWGNVYNCLADNPNYVLDEDEFLSAHLSLIRKPKEAVYSEKLAEERVFKMFCNKPEKYYLDENSESEFEYPLSYSKIEDYILKLSEAAPKWLEIHNSQNPILNKIFLLNRSKELKVFFLAVFLKTKDVRDRNLVLDNIEKILFRNRIPGISIMDERNPATWARDLYNDEDSLIGIQKKQNILLATEIPVTNLIQSMNNLFTYERGAKGFHRWNILKYFLFEYDEYLKIRFRETTSKVLWKDYDETTIEHIIPQHFYDYWSDEVSAVTDKIAAEKKDLAIKIMLNTLGNLTILKNGKNSSLGNTGWKNKKGRFSTGSYNEIDISKKTRWNKNSISKRGIDMLDFLTQKVDGLQLDVSQKKALLFYDPEVSREFRI